MHVLSRRFYDVIENTIIIHFIYNVADIQGRKKSRHDRLRAKGGVQQLLNKDERRRKG